MDCRPPILIYRDHVLGASETFVLAQGEALRRFRPFYVGSRAVNGLTTPRERTLLLNDGGMWGRAKEVLFKLSGTFAPIRRMQGLAPVLVHAHFGPDGVLAMPIARKLNVPLIVTLHGFDVTASDDALAAVGYCYRKYIRERPLLWRNACVFIAVSEFAKKSAIGRGFPADKVLLHYTGIDTQFFTPTPSVRREPIVLFVGRLVEKKGCTYVIEAMSEVQKVIPDAKLVVIGDGHLRPALEKQAANSLRNCQFLGTKDALAVRSWMNRALVFCTPSLIASSGDAETFGMVFAEAQCMGLPVVSFSSGGIPEVVAHGQTGLLTSEKNWQELAAHILTLLNNKSLWTRMSCAGKQRVRMKFDITKQCAALESLYVQNARLNSRQREYCKAL